MAGSLLTRELIVSGVCPQKYAENCRNSLQGEDEYIKQIVIQPTEIDEFFEESEWPLEAPAPVALHCKHISSFDLDVARMFRLHVS